jgi:hypothetical protein
MASTETHEMSMLMVVASCRARSRNKRFVPGMSSGFAGFSGVSALADFSS